MKRTILEVKNPRYSNSDNTYIDVDVKFAEIVENGEPVFIPFTAVENDVELHGRELFTRAINGDFGEIQPYQGE